MWVLRCFAAGYIALSFWHRDPDAFWFGVKAFLLGTIICSLFSSRNRNG